MGFESAAIYGEECKDPQRTVARATYIAVTIIGVFYAVSAWATVMAVGRPDHRHVQEFHRGSVVRLFEQLVGKWFADVAVVLFVTSLFAALLSFQEWWSRGAFSLSAKEGVLPSALAKVNTKGALRSARSPRPLSPWC